jgi:hypothetical protein
MTELPRTIKTREAPDASQRTLTASGLSPVLARVLAARGIKTNNDLDDSLTRLAAGRNIEELSYGGQVISRYDC